MVNYYLRVEKYIQWKIVLKVPVMLKNIEITLLSKYNKKDVKFSLYSRIIDEMHEKEKNNILMIADKRLYKAKNTNKNKIIYE